MKKHLILISLLGALATAALVGCGTTSSAGTSTPAAQTQSSTQQSPATPNTASSSSSSGASTTASSGQASYQKYCAGCHQKTPKASDANKVAAIIKNGKEKMPAFSGTIPDAEIQAIANYVATGK